MSASAGSRRQLSPSGGLRFESVVLLAYLGGLVVLVGLTLRLNNGYFAYSLDDAYIHLAVAENISWGHYGINLEEPSSPSSSILWPFLLAPLAHLEHFELAPLVLNVVCMLGAVVLLTRALRSWFGSLLSTGQLLVVLFLIALCCNFWGMPLNGMEHSAQLLLTTAVAIGVVGLVENGRASPLLLASLALGPLIRFENLSLLAMGAMILVAQRHRGKALIVVGVSAACIAAFVAFLVSLGLPYLPSSVLVKSELMSAEGLREWVYAAGENVLEGLAKTRILALLVPLVVMAKRNRTLRGTELWRKNRLYAIFVGGIVAGHLLAGRYDWQGRYEIYLLLAGTVILLWVFRESLAALIQARRTTAIGALVLACLLVGKNQIDATVKSPVYARVTYDINYQMRRFAVDFWRDSVGVNDVGWVSFRNPYYVFDLWGLSSEEARRKRRSATDMRWAERLVRKRGVDLLMVFERWFTDERGAPSSWERIAELSGRSHRTREPTEVVFFLSNPDRRFEVLQALRAFRATLPDGVRLEIQVSPSDRGSDSL